MWYTHAGVGHHRFGCLGTLPRTCACPCPWYFPGAPTKQPTVAPVCHVPRARRDPTPRSRVPTQECIQGMLPLYAGAYRAHRVRSCRQKAVSVTRTEGPPLHQVSADKLRGEKMAPISESCTPNRRYTMLLCDLTPIYLHDLPPEPSAHKYSLNCIHDIVTHCVGLPNALL